MQTGHILELDSAGTDSLPDGEFYKGNPILLPCNLARQYYRYTSVLMEPSPSESGCEYFLIQIMKISILLERSERK
jgi:hypothetical protein